MIVAAAVTPVWAGVSWIALGVLAVVTQAVVLQRRRNAYVVLLKAYMIECALPQSSGIDLKPEDLVQITIQHVNARNNVLSVFMG